MSKLGADRETEIRHRWARGEGATYFATGLLLAELDRLRAIEKAAAKLRADFRKMANAAPMHTQSCARTIGEDGFNGNGNCDCTLGHSATCLESELYHLGLAVVRLRALLADAAVNS